MLEAEHLHSVNLQTAGLLIDYHRPNVTDIQLEWNEQRFLPPHNVMYDVEWPSVII